MDGMRNSFPMARPAVWRAKVSDAMVSMPRLGLIERYAPSNARSASAHRSPTSRGWGRRSPFRGRQPWTILEVAALKGPDGVTVLEGDPHIVQARDERSFQKRINVECKASVGGSNHLCRQVYRETVSRRIGSQGRDLCNPIWLERDGQQAISRAIVEENACIGRSDQCADAQLPQPPNGMLPAGATTEVGSDNQERGISPARL